ncbi:Pyrazinamidase/nicotinamidase [Ooceraea biroi]|nr:Pyrazinamidase/nicotinamidase [Ooceraea biroi]
MNESLDYKQFEALCAQLFGTDEVGEHEWRVREVFELFDANADGALNEEELHRCHEWINATVNPVNVLLIVDVQNDFIDGTLALRKCEYGQDGAEVIKPINRLLKYGRWDKVIYSLDWHPEDHISFFENLGKREVHSESKVTKKSAKVFDTVVFSEPHVTQKLWPKHCVMNTWGAELHKDLHVVPSSEKVYKGQHPDKDAYSAFKEKDVDDTSQVEKILLAIGATHLYVCGIAYDVCVKETCLDGLRLGYRLAVIDDCCRGVKADDVKAAKSLIKKNGGLVTCSYNVLSMVNEGKRSLVMAHNAAKTMI